MKLFNFQKRNIEEPQQVANDVILSALLSDETITEKQALNIPAVARCVNLICETVSMIPVKLYKEEILDGKRKTVEVPEDARCSLLNEDTKDALDGTQFKKAMVRDYLLNGNAYAYINKRRNTVRSLNYVDCGNILITKNTDPIFKDYNISVQGQTYKPFEFLKIMKSTKDGSRGVGIIEENNELLKVAYTTLKFEQNLVSTGGNKKGFINAKNGLTFQEASNTSVEMQLNENKNSINNSILDIFGVPTTWNWETFIKTAIMPILKTIECALNRDLLLEKEKKSLYFAFDTKEIIKGDIKTRFEAYKTALDSNLMQIDEVRYLEDQNYTNIFFKNIYKLALLLSFM